MYASHFAINPIKQNIAEKLQLKFIQEHLSPEYKKLPSKGKDSIYFINGKLVHKKEENQKVKSADFYNSQLDTYVFAKYTHEEGGSQDNQYSDVVMFIEGVDKYLECYPCKTQFLILTDGEYYTLERIQSLSSVVKHKENIHVTNCDAILKNEFHH